MSNKLARLIGVCSDFTFYRFIECNSSVGSNDLALSGRVAVIGTGFIRGRLDQRRRDNSELYLRRLTHWDDIWEDGWSEPVQNADDLALMRELRN